MLKTNLDDVISRVMNSSAWFVVYSIGAILVAAAHATRGIAIPELGMATVLLAGLWGMMASATILMYIKSIRISNAHYKRMLEYAQLGFILTVTFVFSQLSRAHPFVAQTGFLQTAEWLGFFSVVFFVITMLEASLEVFGKYLLADSRKVGVLGAVFLFIVLVHLPLTQTQPALLATIPATIILFAAYLSRRTA